jgi:hypothetical protein
MPFLDRCIFTAVSAGTVDFVVSTAVTGYQTPAQAAAVDGATYGYSAQSSDLSQWEYGEGVYAASSHTLSRATVVGNSLGTTAKVNFSAAPSVSVCALAETVAQALPTLPSGTAIADADISYWAQAGVAVKQAATALWTYVKAKIVAAFNPRTKLLSDTPYFISTTGSDSNPGTSALPFRTMQRFVDVVSSTVDTGGFTVTGNPEAGSFAGFGAKPIVGGGIIQISGAGVSSTSLTAGPNDGVYNTGDIVDWNVTTGADWYFDQLTLDWSSPSFAGGGCFGVTADNHIVLGNPSFTGQVGLSMGSGTGSTTFLNSTGGKFIDTGAAGVTVAGNSAVLDSFAICAGAKGIFFSNYTFTSSFTVGSGFLQGPSLAYLVWGASFSGSGVVGAGYSLGSNSVLFGDTPLPGSTQPNLGGGGMYSAGGGTAYQVTEFSYSETDITTLVLTNGLHSNIALPFSSRARISGPTAGFSIGGFQLSGIAAGGNVAAAINDDGIRLRLYNSTAQTMTVVNEDAGSTAANRIRTLTGANVVLNGPCFATISYDGTDQRWILESHNP